MSQFLKVKPSPTLTPYYSFRASGNMLYESFKDPSSPAARQHMRQHGKFEKIRSQNSSYEWVFLLFPGNFPEAFGWMFCYPLIFLMPWRFRDEAGMIPDEIGKLFFSSKISFFDPIFCQDWSRYKLGHWFKAYAQVWDLKLMINFQNIDLVCCHSQRIAIFWRNIDKNNINVQKIQQKMKAKMKSFVKFNIKIEITTWNDSEPRVQIENLRQNDFLPKIWYPRV